MRVTTKDPSKGILDFNRAMQRFILHRHPPADDLRAWLESYWIVSWDLPEGDYHEQANISHSSVNAALEPEGAFIYGVPGRVFRRRLTGKGKVFGTKFRPGGFFAFSGKSVRSLTGRIVPIGEIFGAKSLEWATACLHTARDEEVVRLADSFWRSCVHSPTDAPSKSVLVAERIQSDRSIVTVAQAAAAVGLDVRALQRMFQLEVGIGPKEVIKRFRLQEAAEALLRETGLSCGDLALKMGYFDQAHFNRDFKSVVGATPEAYRRRQS
jgi:AraC-like DNA-binding protein